MNKNKPVDPREEISKDDSSDVKKVKGQNQAAPPQAKANNTKTNQAREDEEAQKGHS